MKYFIAFLILMMCLYTMISCDFNDGGLALQNNSFKKVGYFRLVDTVKFPNYGYLNGGINEIMSNCKDTLFVVNTNWKHIILERSPNQRLNLYIVDLDTAKKYISIKELLRKNKIIKEYHLSIVDLDKSNWIISYP